MQVVGSGGQNVLWMPLLGWGATFGWSWPHKGVRLELLGGGSVVLQVHMMLIIFCAG